MSKNGIFIWRGQDEELHLAMPLPYLKSRLEVGGGGFFRVEVWEGGGKIGDNKDKEAFLIAVLLLYYL